MPTFSEKELFPESLYSVWLSDSLILMTASLLFYHMVQRQSIVIDYRLAALFAVLLIFCSVGIGIVSLYPYIQRTSDVLRQEDTDNVKQERLYRTMYTIFGTIIVFIQFIIALFIIKGVLHHK